MGLDEMMSAGEAAREYGLHGSTIRHAIRDGLMTGQKIGGIWLVKRSDVEARYGEGRNRKGKYLRKPARA